VLEQVGLVSATSSTVLVTGETGTGKELIARAVHQRSDRHRRLFVAVNCAALPATLVESELFGHEKGAFTGAIARRVGRFEQADGGTLFLDEIGELPLETQAKMLRVLQSGEFERVGGSRPLRANVRIIAASNRDLEQAVRDGRFRSDLYHRLSVFPIHLPPLRERREDIPLLAAYLVTRKARQLGRNIERISSEILDRLTAYDWPGNVRELENAIERACALCEGGVIKREDLPPHVVRHAAAPPPPEGGSDLPIGTTLDSFIKEQEKRFIEETIRFHGGSREKAAKMLGISMATLYRKIEVRATKGKK
jgi:transcriptional regulator with GAF, ATPase, and Fis domain